MGSRSFVEDSLALNFVIQAFISAETRNSSPGAIYKQQLPLHEQALSDDGPRTTGPQQFGGRGQQMREEHQQVFHGD